MLCPNIVLTQVIHFSDCGARQALSAGNMTDLLAATSCLASASPCVERAAAIENFYEKCVSHYFRPGVVELFRHGLYQHEDATRLYVYQEEIAVSQLQSKGNSLYGLGLPLRGAHRSHRQLLRKVRVGVRWRVQGAQCTVHGVACRVQGAGCRV